MACAASIVFANKAVFSYYNFKFVVALTWIHTVSTAAPASSRRGDGAEGASSTASEGLPNQDAAAAHMAIADPAPQVFTWGGMSVLAALGFFTPKKLPPAKVIPVALGFVGYVVLCNISLQINSVGFYQVRADRTSATPCQTRA